MTTSFTINQESQTISAFATIPTHTVGDAPFAIVPPKTSSGLRVAVTVLSGNAPIAYNVVTITGDGPIVLAANQPGTANFSAAPQVTTTFQVNGLSQNLVVNQISPQTASASGSPLQLTLSATSVSNNPVTYSATSTAGTVRATGNTLTVNVSGLTPGQKITVTITGSQAGDSTYAPSTATTTIIVTVTA